ncbi:MAG: ROK family protein [Chloroflexaceae bacterium]|nr:ROK family protein [Chloroflexaceae bacterium]NJO05255.1 ROK family protein [Chloroflexaceae bacterium]
MLHPTELDSTVATLIQEQLTQRNWRILGAQGCVLGIDLGAYGLRVALVDLGNQVYTSSYTDVQGTSPHAMINDAVALAHDLLAAQHIRPEKVLRVGLGFGGPVDAKRGSIRLSPRMSGWENFPLREHFEQVFDAMTLIENDANLIALGEATFGVGKAYNHLLYLHLSSGVGGGLVLNGRLHPGATAVAGEIGHTVVLEGYDKNGTPPTLEEMVSVSGLLRRVTERGLATAKLEDVFGEHPAGQQVVDDTVLLLATRLALIGALIDPDIIVLGGIVVRIGGPAFVQQIGEQVQQYIDPRMLRPIPVVASVLGVDSVAIGALALALDSMSE